MLLDIIQIIISGSLIAAILLQKQGNGLGSAFGGEGNIFMTKRGIEKKLFISTIILSCIFIGLAFFRLII